MVAFLKLAWGFLTSRAGLSIIGLALVAAVVVGHIASDNRTRHERDTWKAAAFDYRDAAGAYKLAWSREKEARDKERKSAVKGARDADASCAARVAEARRSAQAIRRLVERPVPNDANHCPARRVSSASELRAALPPQ